MLKLDRDERIDWFTITVQLRAKGLSIRNVSERTGIPETTIKGWRLGNGRPRFEEAIRVMNFWCDVMKLDISAIPIYNIYKPNIRR